MATTYSNPYVLGNTGVPPDTLGHNATWPEGLARDQANFIYEVRGWDEAHYDINKRDPANGNILWTSQQVVSGSDMHGIAIETDGSWAYTTNAGGDRSKGQGYAWIYRINLAPNIPREQRRTNFTVAGDHIAVYNSGAIPAGDPDQEPLHSIAVAGASIWVTDAKGGRLLKYDKVTGVQQQMITNLPQARGLSVAGNGDLWVAYGSNKVNSYTSNGSFIGSSTLPYPGPITALSIVANTLAVALRTEGVKTYTTAAGKLTTLLGSYGQPFRPGDGAGDRVKDVAGMVQLSDGGIVFSDRVGFNGRVQKANSWVHLALEFTSGCTFNPAQPEVVLTSNRNFYNVEKDGKWTFTGNGMTESYYAPTYFGHYLSTHGGQPKVLKHGSAFFFYFPSGMSLGIYRLIPNEGRAPSLQLCSCLCAGGQPGLDGSTTSEPWLDINRVSWSWTDPVGGGVIRPADQVIYSAQNPSTYRYMNTCTVDSAGTLWIRLMDADALAKIPLNGLNAIGNPIYRWQDASIVLTRNQVKAALGITTNPEFQMASRVDGDVYVMIKVANNPAWPGNFTQWMGCNAMLCIGLDEAVKWAKPTPFWQIGVAALDNAAGGGFVCGSNDAPGGPGTIYHFDKNGVQIKMLRPSALYGDQPQGPRYPSGGLDSYQSINLARDPRDGEVKIFAADNMNQRVIVYSINDGTVPVIPPPVIEPPPSSLPEEIEIEIISGTLKVRIIKP